MTHEYDTDMDSPQKCCHYVDTGIDESSVLGVTVYQHAV